MKNKTIVRISIFLILLAVMAFLFLNENGILKFLEMKNELSRLDVEIKEAEKRLDSLDKEIDSLQVSKAKIERVAREKFHMMKKNETVFKIEEN